MDINEQEKQNYERLAEMVQADLTKQQTIAALRRFTEYWEAVDVTHLHDDDTAAGVRTALSQISVIVHELNQQLIALNMTEQEFAERIKPLALRCNDALKKFGQRADAIILGLEQFETMEKNNGSSVN